MNSTNTRGITPDLTKNLVIGSGAIYIHYGTEQEKILAATTDANTFKVENSSFALRVNGVMSEHVKGLKIKTGEVATLEANLLEMTSEILKIALTGQVDSDTDPDYDVITGKDIIEDEDYIDNIAIVGNISGSDKPVIVILENVLVLDGLEMQRQDTEANSLPVTFTAHADMDSLSSPYKIKYPKKEVTP